MFDNKSDYALNKQDKDSIVYSGSDGTISRISQNDFSSEEEFLFLKITKKRIMPMLTIIDTQSDWIALGTISKTLPPRKKC